MPIVTMHQSQNMLFNYMINLVCSAHISYTFGDSFPMQNLCGTHLNQSVQVTANQISYLCILQRSDRTH